ncbi:hypothetical protein RLW55_04075 [Hyphomicrobium sp. B1]|uniref:hypothetical protein n=1 Tax=Hyphomicrobium sp. B1 TaxID=3075651 RepID=UPI003C2F524C
MRNIFILATIGLASCAAGGETQIYTGGLIGQRVVGNEAYVTIFNVWNEMDALPLADQHCAKYNKVAKFNRMESVRAIFDCVARTQSASR